MNFSKEQKRIAYQKLSDKIKDFISSNNILDLIKSISNENDLNTEQYDLLDTETYSTMLGLQTPREIGAMLEKNIFFPKDKIPRIMSELKEKIFTPLDFLENRKTPSEENILVKQAENLIEDAEGNRDNVLPILVKPVTPLPIPKTAETPSQLEQKLGSQLESTQGASRDAVMKQAYPKQDPYREPVN